MISFTPFHASATRTLALDLHQPISSANPKFKIQNPRVSASRNRGTHPAPTRSGFRTFIPSHIKTLRSSARFTETERSRAAFTLVELLAVVGIMGLLAAVGVPALKGLTGSGGRKQALSQLMGALEIARNTAISTGTNAAVIFPDQSFTNQAYRYRSMAVVAWNPTETNLPTTMVGSWIVLPQGVAFFPNSLKTANLPTAKNISVRILTASNTANFPAIIFQPDGGLSEDYSPLPTNGIAFFEGTVTGTTTNPTSKMTNFETIRLTKYTGRTLPTLAPPP